MQRRNNYSSRPSLCSALRGQGAVTQSEVGPSTTRQWIPRLRFAPRGMTVVCHPARSRRVHVARRGAGLWIPRLRFAPRGMTGVRHPEPRYCGEGPCERSFPPQLLCGLCILCVLRVPPLCDLCVLSDKPDKRQPPCSQQKVEQRMSPLHFSAQRLCGLCYPLWALLPSVGSVTLCGLCVPPLNSR
jgi:hypothetical protein